MANSGCEDFQVNPWKEYRYSNRYDNPVFHPNAGHGNNQLPWFTTHYTHLAGRDGRGIGLIGARTIRHPGTTVSRSSFYAPPRPGDHIYGSSIQPRQQGLVHWRAILQQATPCDYFSQGNTMISSHISCDPRPGVIQSAKMYTAIPGQCDPQMVPAPTPGYVQPPYIAPSLLDNGVSDITFNSPGQKTSVNDAGRRCPICSALLGRLQERRRHIVSHLPFWLQCPDPACSWRESRWEALKNHRRKNHPSSSQEHHDDKSNSIIYDPWPLVKEITECTISIEDAGDIAKSMVVKRASELGKLGIWGDFWGRKRRKLGRAHGTITDCKFAIN